MNPEHALPSASHFIPVFAATCMETLQPVKDMLKAMQDYDYDTTTGLFAIKFTITFLKLVAKQRDFNQ